MVNITGITWIYLLTRHRWEELSLNKSVSYLMDSEMFQDWKARP